MGGWLTSLWVPIACSGLALGQTRADSGPVLPELLPRDREMALALSAAPEHLRKDVTVYVLERGGYARAKQGTNGFSCLVEHDHPLDIVPICYDAEGTEAILPVSLRTAELRAQGKSDDEIRREINEGFRAGKYRPPRRVSIAYMLSREQHFFNRESGKAVPITPHVMIYAPYLTNVDIGASPASPARTGEHSRLPVIVGEGRPHAFIVFPMQE